MPYIHPKDHDTINLLDGDDIIGRGTIMNLDHTTEKMQGSGELELLQAYTHTQTLERTHKVRYCNFFFFFTTQKEVFKRDNIKLIYNRVYTSGP